MPPRKRKTDDAPELDLEGTAEQVEETDIDSTEDEPAPDAEKSTEDAEEAECGSNLADFNPLYRDILCVLPAGHEGPHTDGENGQWPNADDPVTLEVFDPMQLCEEHYPEGWPSTEYGASASCPHGTWTYPISK